MSPLQSLDVLYINACVTYATLSVSYFALSKQGALGPASPLSGRILWGMVAGLLSWYLTGSKIYFTAQIHYTFEIVPMLLVTFFGGWCAGLTAWLLNFITTGGFVLDNLFIGMMLAPVLLARVWRRNTLRTFILCISLVTLFRLLIVIPYVTRRIYLLDVLLHQTISYFCLLVCYQTLALKQRSISAYFTLSESALRDQLTQTNNRQGLQQQILRLEHSRSACCIAMIDIDNFKQINDRYGHLCGDRVLTAIAAIASQTLQPRDYMARFGGEEFVILFPGKTLERANARCEQIRQAICATPLYLCHDQQIRATASFGLSYFDGRDSLQQAIARADGALYRAKRRGKNRVECA
ncbi:GGDEF domain-containing protein [Edwardsiella ictaluri]|uniref:GGDEF domain-containing protein n=1 Tax=Edwardsiella ictaluri TaxID=67780 RepID=UPI0018DB0C5E|nr:GGDEF domain-containing protein [Edwardsiella ictaluri]QPW30359.1 GGDEF domain-containing protein [Edwardsiella ictaluri]WJH21374.1 GGDEF domain-containing protein [Edwardsiella ictaluri]BEH99306.1 GGDEF domain-containing protein [Edwardsiella ictaluri]BEI02798.1 GGDEF domain-containing protein [Edwardsiella ictaluri]BEI06260.1 GGDEF domain-containing protein [Edwardsiella ictaluri]